MIVAPSFVIVTSPSGLTNNLSIPFGPRDVRNNLEIDLSKTSSGWERCQLVTDEQAKRDLIQLATFKKKATQGTSPTEALEKLSYLGRAVVETVRVYPPIWTLPRNWKSSEGYISSKFGKLDSA